MEGTALRRHRTAGLRLPGRGLGFWATGKQMPSIDLYKEAERLVIGKL